MVFSSGRRGGFPLVHAMSRGRTLREMAALVPLLRAGRRAAAKRTHTAAALGVSVPQALILSLTQACTETCSFCLAAESVEGPEMDDATIQRIVSEARDLGVFVVALAGGEPLLRKDLVFRLVRDHPDTLFLLLTGGGRVDHETARRAAARNLLVLIGVDEERRTGATAVPALRAAGASFGFTAVVHEGNAARCASRGFLAKRHAEGCRTGIFFERMPVGRAAGSDYGFDAASRSGFRRAIRERQAEIGIPLHFFPDGEGEIGGCTAAGRAALHVNACGGVEPCPFIRIPVGNAGEMSFADVLREPGLAAVREVAARHADHRPCALLGNPALTEAVQGGVTEKHASP